MFDVSDVLVGPLIAMAALGLIVVMCRWVFSTQTRDQRAARRRVAAPASRDYGLLVPVTTVRTPEDAELLRDVLRRAGIRGTVVAEPDGRLALLVFRSDADSARALLVAR